MISLTNWHLRHPVFLSSAERIFIATLGVTLSLVTAGCSSEETLQESYTDWNAANLSGSIKRGWLPIWLPKEAKNIQEKHDLDTNAIALSFEVASPNFQIDEVKCKTALEAPKPHIRIKNFPTGIHKAGDLKICDGFYVYQLEKTFFLWKNKA